MWFSLYFYWIVPIWREGEKKCEEHILDPKDMTAWWEWSRGQI